MRRRSRYYYSNEPENSGDENHIVMNERVQALAGSIYEVTLIYIPFFPPNLLQKSLFHRLELRENLIIFKKSCLFTTCLNKKWVR